MFWTKPVVIQVLFNAHYYYVIIIITITTVIIFNDY